MSNVKRHRPHTKPRAGFTLVEILIVIVIISVLIAMLLPAIQNIWGGARDARVKAEIAQLETAIGQFKQVFGVEPPSSLTICEAAGDWNTVAGGPASMAMIRRIWPQFDFTTQKRNGDNDMVDSVTLTPQECLVFFLGGVPSGSGTSYTCTGFSKNPTNPGAPIATGGSRDGPFLEFDPTRLRATDKNGFTLLTYVDSFPSQTSPYLYLSSNDGQGYNLSGTELPVGFTSVYLVALANPAATPPTPAMPYKPQSFQIISPGPDADYGVGGLFNPNAVNSGLPSISSTYPGGDYDNLTNFNNGRLKP